MPSAAHLHQRVKSQIQVTTRKVGQTRHKPKTAGERSPLCGQFSSPRSGTLLPKLMSGPSSILAQLWALAKDLRITRIRKTGMSLRRFRISDFILE